MKPPVTKLALLVIVLGLPGSNITKGQTAVSSPISASGGNTTAKSADAVPPKTDQATENKDGEKPGLALIANETKDSPSKGSTTAAKVLRLREGDQLGVEVSDLKKRIETNPDIVKTARLVLDCKRMDDLIPDCISENKILFTVPRTTMEQVTPRTKIVPISVDLGDAKNMPATPDKVELAFIAYDRRFAVVLAIIAIIALLLLVYGCYTNLLRDGHPPNPQSAETNKVAFPLLSYLPGFENVMPDRGELSAYSLSKVQMAWWFFVIVAAFLFIWLAVGDFNSLTSSTLVLFGISAGTTVASRMISSSKQSTVQDLNAKHDTLQQQVDQLKAQTGQSGEAPPVGGAAPPAGGAAPPVGGAAPPVGGAAPPVGGAAPPVGGAAPPVGNLTALKQDLDTKAVQLNQTKTQVSQLTIKPDEAKSNGFLTDITSDENGISIHRFQMVVWTVVLTLIFLREVYTNLTMPQFSDTLLTLMGISSGTYLALKVPEKKSVVALGSSD